MADVPTPPRCSSCSRIPGGCPTPAACGWDDETEQRDREWRRDLTLAAVLIALLAAVFVVLTWRA